MPKRKKKHNIVNDLFPESISDKINSKKKGDRNENVLGKLLSKWVGTEFARVPRSGGIKWKSSQNLAGDVIVVNPKFKFPFCVETKHYQKLSFEQRLNSKIFTFWEQAKIAADSELRIPLLFVKQNGMKDYVMFTDMLLPVIEKYYVTKKEYFYFFDMHNKSDRVFTLYGHHTTNLFRRLSYKEFKKAFKNYYHKI